MKQRPEKEENKEDNVHTTPCKDVSQRTHLYKDFIWKKVIVKLDNTDSSHLSYK
jgi:hypothetical protein